MVYNCKILCFSGNKQQIRFYTRDIHVKDRVTEIIQEKRSMTRYVKLENDIESDKDFSAYVSKQRTINEIYNITRSNEWDYFITMTFDPKRVNRYDYDDCMYCARRYFKYLQKNYEQELKYFIIPEKHKDGAWHIHGLIASKNITRVYSGHNDKKGRKIYHLPNYIYGFSDCTKISNQFAACSYMTKYVTKDLCCDTQYRNRYLKSRNVNTVKEKCFRISNDTLKRVLSEMENVIYTKTVESGEEYTIYIETENSENVFDFIKTELEFEDVE